MIADVLLACRPLIVQAFAVSTFGVTLAGYSEWSTLVVSTFGVGLFVPPKGHSTCSMGHSFARVLVAACAALQFCSTH